MKRLSNLALSAFAASLACLSASAAVNLSDKSDLRFAEEYAFSTNRAALIATLRPESPAWFTYSILLAQTEGRLDDAQKLISRWLDFDKRDSQSLDSFVARQTLLGWGKNGLHDLVELRKALGNCGITVGEHPRKTPLAPNTYPSTLDQKKISFEKVLSPNNLSARYSFLRVTKEGVFADPWRRNWRFDPHQKGLLPDTPGLFEEALLWLKSSDKTHFFSDAAVFRSFTLDQLHRLAEELKDTAKDLRSNESYARIVLSKMKRGADDDPDDFASELALARRRMEFADTLLPSLRNVKKQEFRAYLDLMRSCGKYAEARDEFAKYVAMLAVSQANDKELPVRPDDIVKDYLSAYRLAGDDLAGFAGKIEQVAFARICAEADLLAGRDPAQVDTGCLPPEMFKSIQERVELNWAKSNPRAFASDDDVSLSMDVKNVKRMRLAVYVLDPFSACKVLGGEAKADLDLDAAVPTFVRTMDYSQFAPLVRHTETFALPELKLPGVYVVECTGGGVASRALVRKGRLRVTHRRDSAGHVFVALDEKGAVVKGTKLRLGETVFTADEDGEIAVPFAPDKKSAGVKTAVVTDGRLASSISFEHHAENIHLSLELVLRTESLVAGQEATALLRPKLDISGEPAPLALLKRPVLTAEFRDLDRRTSVTAFPGATLSDDAETAVSFRVPERLASVKFSLKGTVASAVTGKDEPCSAATGGMNVNNIQLTSTVGQAILRHADSGWRVELRGRTGEPLASRAVSVALRHCAFEHEIRETLQADENGVVELGALADISAVSLDFEGCHYSWSIGQDSLDPLPPSLSVAAGESVEIPLRNLLAGEWPGAGKLNFRISLLGLNGDGETTADWIGACSYSDGILRIKGLPAGDYALTLRDRKESCRLYVGAAAPGTAGAGHVIASAARSLSDTGSPALLRIASASRDAAGKFTIRLENATSGTRVHVFAAMAFGGTSECNPFCALKSMLDWKGVSCGTWGGRRTDYVSGRNLGERLRYILDRRDQPRYVGNMLSKPSLLLAPWSTTETQTSDIKLEEGESWAGVDASMPGESLRRGRGHFGDIPWKGFNSWDFLPRGAHIVANLRPDKDGIVSFELAGPWQDYSIIATDGRAIDHVKLLGPADGIAPRDLTHSAVDSKSYSSIAKGYSTFGELFALSQSLCPGEAIAEFRPLASWSALSDDEKRAFYGEHICHELNFFLYMKDRPFFDAVVAPHLKNKRFRQFMDKWLLGEDVSEYAKPGRLDELNALEQGLLAQRVPAIAPAVARRMGDECEAYPTSPEDVDAAFDIALDAMNQSARMARNAPLGAFVRAEGSSNRGMRAIAAKAPVPQEAAMDEVCAAVESPLLEEIEPPEIENVDVAGEDTVNVADEVAEQNVLRAMRRVAVEKKKEISRRKSRQLYRPPDRTREWVESHWWKARQDADSSALVPVNEFWRDWTAAIASGKLDGFRSPNMCLVRSGFTAQLAALAVTDIPFAAKDGDEGMVFRRERPEGNDKVSPVVVTQRFRDPSAARADGSLGAEVSDEFVRGRVYEQVTVLTNPTDDRRRASAFIQIPEGAVALGGGKPVNDARMVLDPYYVHRSVTAFYFPCGLGSKEGADKRRLAAAEVMEADGSSSRSQTFECNVVAKPSKSDETSWEYLSQNGSKSAVLDYLRNKNLAAIDLAAIQWRMIDNSFAGKVLEILSMRGVYCQDLWLAGLLWRGSSDEARIREALARSDNQKKLGRKLGPAMVSPLATVDPELAGVFEHKEYWPIVNARAHFVGGEAKIANEGLKNEYRQFVDTLAAKKKPTARDRVLAAVYLLAQDRIDEAKAHIAAALPAKEPYKMQLDYLRAYLSFCDGDAESGRAIAAPYMNYPVALWRDRFRAVVAQADEALGEDRGAAAESDADAAPSLSIADDSGSVAITARNLSECVLKAYPVDVEVAFSKDPFGAAAKGRETVCCLAPKWSCVASLKDGRARVQLPKEIASENIVLVAEGAEGRAEARLERTPREFDVQVTREYRQLRVKGSDGKAIPGAYVKVYAKDASGIEVEFHKDGYTDMRGAFDYASISTDSQFKPVEFSILVLPEGRGANILRVPAE